METKKVLAIVSMVLSLGGTSWASTKPSNYDDMVKNDQELSNRIGQALIAEERLPSYEWKNIDFSVKNGEVTLTGKVSTKDQKKYALEIVKRNGAKTVIDHLYSNEEQMEKTEFAP